MSGGEPFTIADLIERPAFSVPTIASSTITAREHWLAAAINKLRPRFEKYGKLPDKIHTIVSWPKGSKALGQHFGPTWTKDKSHYVIISPVLDDPAEILAILIHELLHAIGLKKHGKEFKKMGNELGLEGDMRSSHANETLAAELKELAKTIGNFPHEKMIEPTKEIKERVKSKIKYVDPENPSYEIWMKRGQGNPPLTPITKKPMVEALEQ